MRDFEDYGIRVDQVGKEEQKVPCPKCQTRDKAKKDWALCVNIKNNVWHCKKCGWSGGLSTKTKTFNFNAVKPTGTTITDKEIMRRWFRDRGISVNTLNENKVEFRKFNNKAWVTFNYYFGDTLVNQKLRTRDKEFRQTKGGSQVYYNLNNIIQKEEIIITEGEIDTLSFYEAGLKNTASVPGGGKLSTENKKMEFIENSHELITADKIYLATDNDAKGIGLRDELAKRYGFHRCYILDFPDGCKDANDVLVKYGEQGKSKLKELITLAEPYPVEEYHKPQSKKDYYLDYLADPFTPPLKTGIQDLDNLINNLTGALVTITGIPSHGKTTFAEMLLLRYAENEGQRFLIYSGEHKIKDSIFKLTRAHLLRETNKVSHEKREEAFEFITKHFDFLDLKEQFSIDTILEKVKYGVEKYNIDGFLIDNWSTIQLNPDNLSETTYIGSILNKLQNFCREYEVTCYLIAHPRKMEAKGTGFKKPDLYSISGSSNFYNFTDVGIIIYRDEDYTEVTIQKSRDKNYAKQGKFHLQYNAYGDTLVEKEFIPEMNRRF